MTTPTLLALLALHRQVQQALPGDILILFHTEIVDRFLRTLILYCFYFIQTCEWLALKSRLNNRPGRERIIEPWLSAAQRQRKRNLASLRVVLARDYLALLAGEGASHRFHHMANGVQSWSQRDARLWELLLQLSVRVAYVALRRRNLQAIDMEVGRLFRGEAFNMAVRRQRPVRAAKRSARQVLEKRLQNEIVYGPPAEGPEAHRRLFTLSPAFLEMMGRPGEPPHWTVLALGRTPVPDLPESLRRVEAAYVLDEEELVRTHCLYIGILGMPRGNLDVMLNIRDKQKRQELMLSTAVSSAGQQCSSLFPTEEDQPSA